MATFETDFEDDPLGSFPGYLAIADRLEGDGQYYEVTDSPEGRRLTRAGGASSQSQEGCRLAGFFTSGVSEMLLVIEGNPHDERSIRIAGDFGGHNSNNEGGYAIDIDSTNGTVNLNAITDKFNHTTIDSGTATLNPNGLNVLLIRYEPGSPNTVRGKTWALGDSEPANWQVEATDDTAVVGSEFMAHARWGGWYPIHYWSAGTDSDSAPRPNGSPWATYSVNVEVTEGDDTTPIEGVVVQWEASDGTLLDEGTTDADGKCSLSGEIADDDLPDDTEVYASADGYANQLKIVTVDTSSTSYTVDFSLSPEAAVLSPSSARQTQLADAAGLQQAHALTAADTAQPQMAETPSLMQRHALTVEGLRKTQETTTPTLQQVHVVTPTGARQARHVEAPTLHLVYAIEPAAVRQKTRSGTAALLLTYRIRPTTARQPQAASAPSLNQTHVLLPARALQPQRLETLRVRYGFPGSSLASRIRWPDLPIPKMAPASMFYNATATITRPEGTRTAAGFTEGEPEPVLSGKADFQSSGRALQRLQAVHERGDALLFLDGAEEARPADEVTVSLEDGRTLRGQVEAALELDGALLIVLD